MKETIAERKERYIDEACRRELGALKEADAEEIAERIKFWQSLSSAARFNAAQEITRRVHTQTTGDPNDSK